MELAGCFQVDFDVSEGRTANDEMFEHYTFLSLECCEVIVPIYALSALISSEKRTVCAKSKVAVRCL
jgi:hypothetical protein